MIRPDPHSKIQMIYELKQELSTCTKCAKTPLLHPYRREAENKPTGRQMLTQEIVKAKEEAYEAKRIQPITVSADEFNLAGRKTSRSHPLTQTSTESKASSSVTYPPTYWGVTAITYLRISCPRSSAHE